MRNNRILIAVLLVCCLLRFDITAQAQDNIPWLAESVAMSTNGRHLAVIYATDEWDGYNFVREVWTYNLADLLSPPVFLAKVDEVGADLSFSPDSKKIAVGDRGRLRMYNTEDNSLVIEIPNPSSEESADFRLQSFSPDGEHIMAFSYVWRTHYSEMSIWDIETGIRIFAVPVYQSLEIVELPWLSSDWRQFLDWSHSDGVRISEFDIEQGIGSHLATFSDAASGAAFSPDSSLFALATTEGDIQVFRTDTWDLTYIQVLAEHSCGSSLVTLAFGHINPWLVCYGDGWLFVWDIKTGELLLRDKPAGSFSHISLDDGVLFADDIIHIDVDYTISAWDANNAFEKTTYPGLIPQLHPNGELMAALNPDQRVWIWNIKSKQVLVILPAPRH